METPRRIYLPGRSIGRDRQSMNAMQHSAGGQASDLFDSVMLDTMLGYDNDKKLLLVQMLVNSMTATASSEHGERVSKERPRLMKPNKPLGQSVDYLKALAVRGAKPVPADIDDFGLFAEKYV